jgi:hypothetical protein
VQPLIWPIVIGTGSALLVALAPWRRPALPAAAAALACLAVYLTLMPAISAGSVVTTSFWASPRP